MNKKGQGRRSNPDDGGGSENVAKKWIFLLRNFIASNVGYFSWSWILKEFILVQKRKKNSSSFVHVLHKSSHQEVSRQRNLLKSLMHVQSSCFARRTNCLLMLSLSSSCLPKLPNIGKVLSLQCCAFLYAYPFSTWLLTQHLTNFRPAEKFDRPLLSHGTVQNFCSVHTNFERLDV